jgi:hypothetical protein
MEGTPAMPDVAVGDRRPEILGTSGSSSGSVRMDSIMAPDGHKGWAFGHKKKRPSGRKRDGPALFPRSAVGQVTADAGGGAADDAGCRRVPSPLKTFPD